MKAKSLSKSNKSKNFTFRITEELSTQMAVLKAMCEERGVRLNLTEALTAALVKELKAVERDLLVIAVHGPADKTEYAYGESGEKVGILAPDTGHPEGLRVAKLFDQPDED